MKPFLILTNDDGVHAEGILALRDAAAQVWDTMVVAPDREQSAQSHALTLNRPLRAHEVADGVFSVDGTPTDCMMLALRGLLDRTPDLAVSGINHGANLGDDVIYSGTVAGAAEATLLGLPAIAVSMTDPDRTDVKWAAGVTVKIIKAVLANRLPAGVFLNVNIPPVWSGGRVEITRQGTRRYRDVITRLLDPRGRPCYWIGGELEKAGGSDSSDFAAIERGNVSITPLHLDMTATHVLTDLESWSFE